MKAFEGMINSHQCPLSTRDFALWDPESTTETSFKNVTLSMVAVFFELIMVNDGKNLTAITEQSTG